MDNYSPVHTELHITNTGNTDSISAGKYQYFNTAYNYHSI